MKASVLSEPVRWWLEAERLVWSFCEAIAIEAWKRKSGLFESFVIRWKIENLSLLKNEEKLFKLIFFNKNFGITDDCPQAFFVRVTAWYCELYQSTGRHCKRRKSASYENSSDSVMKLNVEWCGVDMRFKHSQFVCLEATVRTYGFAFLMIMAKMCRDITK